MRSRGGFSLLELIIVVGVIWAIIGLVLPSFRGVQNETKISVAKSELSIIKNAVDSYRRYNNDSLPADINQTLLSATPRLLTKRFTDPFSPDKSGYQYVTDNISGFGPLYVIYSVGLERQGTVSWNHTASANVIVYPVNYAIAVSNAPVDD